MPPPRGPVSLQLRPWQIEALDAWEVAGRHAIIAAATGTGKTRLAVAAMARLGGSWRIVITVPTKSLQVQWIRELTRTLGIHPDQIGTIGGTSPRLSMNQRYVIAVLASARDRLPALVHHWGAAGHPTFLVVDECHWAGARVTARRLFSTSYAATLGLSATPERGDDGLDEFLVPYLGDIAYRYPLRQALDDGLLAPLTAVNIYIDLAELETREYQQLEERIANLVRTGQGESSNAVRAMRRSQQQILRRAGGRVVALKSLIDGGMLTGRRTLLFHETIEQAEITTEILNQAGESFTLEHSKLPTDSRASALRRFASGTVDSLVTVRALDEGIDVPEANTAVIVSGTMNPRQRMQRIGRIVRPAGGPALAVTLLAKGTTEENVVGGNDRLLLGQERVINRRDWRS